MSPSIVNLSDISKRAHAIYARDIHSVVETEENIGKMLVLDVEQEEYEIDADGITALDRLRKRCPEITPRSTYAFRIGYDAVFGVGGAITRTIP